MRLNALSPAEPSPSPTGAPVSAGPDRRLDVIEAGTVEYGEAWSWQQRLSAARLDGTGPDTVLLLQHPPVYTAGKRTRPADRPTDGSPVIDVDRGGRITWHGPGQLVGYPIVALAQPIDVVAYVRILEEVLIATCASLGLTTGRVEGRSGVWLAADPDGGRPERKIAAIGVRIARSITQHGFSLNCNPDLSAYDRIVPCGIEDAGVTSLTSELRREVSVEEMLPVVTPLLRAALEGELPIREHVLVIPTPAAGVQWDLHPALG